jgi:hypothetical protein
VVNKSPLQPTSSRKAGSTPNDIRSWLAPNPGKGKENRDVNETREVKGKVKATASAERSEIKKKKKRIESDESDFVMEEEPPSEGEEGSASDFEAVEEEPKTDDDLESVIDDVGMCRRCDGRASDDSSCQLTSPSRRILAGCGSPQWRRRRLSTCASIRVAQLIRCQAVGAEGGHSHRSQEHQRGSAADARRRGDV